MKASQVDRTNCSLRPIPKAAGIGKSIDPWIAFSRGDESRSATTAIYYLLEQQQLSRWHVVDADEIWHFYAGAPLELLAYDPASRQLSRHVLNAPGAGSSPIGVIPAGVWQAARSLGEYSLVGCTVSPGFEFSGFRFTADLPDHRAHFTGEMSQYAALL